METQTKKQATGNTEDNNESAFEKVFKRIQTTKTRENAKKKSKGEGISTNISSIP